MRFYVRRGTGINVDKRVNTQLNANKREKTQPANKPGFKPKNQTETQTTKFT